MTVLWGFNIQNRRKKDAKVKFSPEAVEKLRDNKFVLSATENSVQFTPEFKAIIINESKQGKTQKLLLKDFEIDSKLFSNI